MRGYTNSTEIKMYSVLILMTLPTAALCYNGQLSLGAIGPTTLLIMLFVILTTSFVDVPIAKIRSKKLEQLTRYAPILEDIYSVPVVRELNIGKDRVFDTTVTLNLGGAIIPALMIVYVLLMEPNTTALQVMLIVVVVATLLSEMTAGVGIVTPVAIGITALPFSLIVAPDNAAVITFIAGVGGILIGNAISAMTFNRERSGSAFISIGGAGSFIPIYITIIVAVLISYFIH